MVQFYQRTGEMSPWRPATEVLRMIIGLKVGLQEPARSTRGQRWLLLVELNLNI